MSKLAGYVTVHDDDGISFTFGPGDDVPGWAVDKISNPNVWATEKAAPVKAPVEAGPAETEKPKRGPGRPAKTE